MKKAKSSRRNLGKWLIIAGVFDLFHMTSLGIIIGIVSVVFGTINLYAAREAAEPLKYRSGCLAVGISGIVSAVIGIITAGVNLNHYCIPAASAFENYREDIGAIRVMVIICMVSIIFSLTSLILNAILVKKCTRDVEILRYVCPNCQNDINSGDTVCSRCGVPFSWSEDELAKQEQNEEIIEKIY